jgi:hypothetical protein
MKITAMVRCKVGLVQLCPPRLALALDEEMYSTTVCHGWPASCESLKLLLAETSKGEGHAVHTLDEALIEHPIVYSISYGSGEP